MNFVTIDDFFLIERKPNKPIVRMSYDSLKTVVKYCSTDKKKLIV